MNFLKVPEILNIPPKLFSFITKFNNYNYFLLEGGRASGKTQSVARFLLYIMEKRRVRICCGREIQNSFPERLCSGMDEKTHAAFLAALAIIKDNLKSMQEGEEE